eukprot:gene2161-3397_t
MPLDKDGRCLLPPRRSIRMAGACTLYAARRVRGRTGSRPPKPTVMSARCFAHFSTAPMAGLP